MIINLNDNNNNFQDEFWHLNKNEIINNVLVNSNIKWIIIYLQTYYNLIRRGGGGVTLLFTTILRTFTFEASLFRKLMLRRWRVSFALDSGCVRSSDTGISIFSGIQFVFCW